MQIAGVLFALLALVAVTACSSGPVSPESDRFTEHRIETDLSD